MPDVAPDTRAKLDRVADRATVAGDDRLLADMTVAAINWSADRN